MCLGFEGEAAFYFFLFISFFFLFLNFILYSSGTLKILGDIPLQTHSRSYLKQTSGESESIKFQSHIIA